MSKAHLRIVIALLACGIAQAQIPVTDIAHITTTKMAWVETMAKWKTQYEQMTSQINNLKAQYEAISGYRNLGEIYNNPAFKNYIPQDWATVYDGLRTGGYSGLSGPAQRILDSMQPKKLNIRQFANPEMQKAHDAELAKIATDKATALAGFEAAKGRMSQIDSLMKQINNTSDPKAIAELQARIAIEQTNIQNEQTKLQFFSMAAQVEEKIQEQARYAILNQRSSSTKAPKPQPLFQ